MCTAAELAAFRRRLAKVDPVLANLIRAAGKFDHTPNAEHTPFHTLARAIAHQQLNGTAAESIFGRFVDLGWWIPLAVLGIVLSISGPSMLIAWLKLRQRSLGPILDASGWAINNRMKLSTRLGGSLTKRPQPVPHAVKLPEMRRTARDEGAPAGAPSAAVSEPSL